MNVYKPKRYFIKTYGCQANIADSNTLAGILEALGYEAYDLDLSIETKELANEYDHLLNVLGKVDLFIVNTCSVRQKSEDKVYGLGKVIKNATDLGKTLPFFIMAGCMVGSVTGERQRYSFEDLQKKTPWVNLYINPSQIFDLPEKLKERGVLNDWAVQKFTSASAVNTSGFSRCAFINISYGCDNFCTFCVVPYSRGKEISRSKNEILTEIKHYVARGVTDITLCGQNVNSWGLTMSEKFNIRTGSEFSLPFTSLLKEIHSISEVAKIDFISSNPFDFTQDLVNALKMPKISNYLHMAVQSGNNEILKAMNRRHTVEDFINLISKIRSIKPNIEIGTDIIVGFPGETRDQFMDTVSLVQKVKFNVAYISMYSPRKGTPAERFFKDDIPLEEKKWRHQYLTKVWKDTKVL